MAPTSENSMNMYLPSGTNTLYARVIDGFGATSDDYMDMMVVKAPGASQGRRLLDGFSWDMAVGKVNTAVENKNTADTNMLSSCVAKEAGKAAAGGSLPAKNMTGIVDSLVASLGQSLAATDSTLPSDSSDYMCELAGAMSAVTGKPAYVSNSSVLPAVELINKLATSDKMAKMSKDCAIEFYTSFGSAISTQNTLSAVDSMTSDASAKVVNILEGSSFRIMSLLAKALINGMSSTVSSDATTGIVSRQLADSNGQSKIFTSKTSTLGQQKYSLAMPNMAQLLNFSSDVVLDTVLELSEKTPVVPGAQILSMGVAISLGKDGAKLVVANLSTPIVFTIPLVKRADPAPSGLQVKCKPAYPTVV